MSAARPGAEARRLASRLIHDVVAAHAAALRPDGIDLTPAVEQVLFAALRAPTPPTTRRRVLRAVRRPRALLSALRPGQALPAADVLVVVLSPIHRLLFESVRHELRALAPDLTVSFVAAGRALTAPQLTGMPSIASARGMRDAWRLLRASGGAALGGATAAWPDAAEGVAAADLRRLLVDCVDRLAVAAIQMDAAIANVRPRLVVTYDEIDAWGRLVTAIAPRHGARTLDLPHAEAVDVEAIRGCAYDVMAVYGPRARDVLAEAGVPRDRIEVVGPAAFDPFVRAEPGPRADPPRVVMAAQYRGGRMTDEVREGILTAAVWAAQSIDGELVLRPHPGERPEAWKAAVRRVRARSAASLRIDAITGLSELLAGATVLVTGWSNSVYEAVLAGVPAITVNVLEGEPPMPFAAEGISDEARTPAETAALAVALLDTDRRRQRLDRARRGLAAHLGPLDGRAARRSAELVVRLAAP